MIPLHDDNPTDLTPLVTFTLIGLCVLVFMWQLTLGGDGQHVAYSLGVIPAVLFHHGALTADLDVVPAWVTVFTSMFLHGGWMHLIGNMLYLWIFGNNVEDCMGRARFIVFYLLCGVAAVFAQALADTTSHVPMIGASGAISGVLGAYLLLHPHARILVAIPLGLFLHTARLPAAWVLVGWFVLQLVSSIMASNEGGGVAWGAHIGGFIAGVALIPLFRRKGVRLFVPFVR
ncbi:MAG: rhomboid family intramembrane serine protease [Gammaproteobacteria bacterium]